MPIRSIANKKPSTETMPQRPAPVTRMGDISRKQAANTQIQWELHTPAHSLEDMILDDNTYSQLLDIVSYYKNHDLLFNIWGLNERFFRQAGLAANLYGPPGTGKTMAAHAIADALQIQMICVDYAEIESKYVGETSKNLKNLFQMAATNNAAIFFDEADALLSKRVTNMTSATDVSVNQTRSVLLNLLNGHCGVIIFATNFIQNFDAAFLRRIKYHVAFSLPDLKLRERLWRMYIPKEMPCTANCAELAKKFEGISGSDISNAVFTAAVQAARYEESEVKQERFELAIQRSIDAKKANQGSQVQVIKQPITEAEARNALGLGYCT